MEPEISEGPFFGGSTYQAPKANTPSKKKGLYNKALLKETNG